MTEFSSMIESEARHQIIELVVTHFIAQDMDPRKTTADDMLTEMSEGLHWDALDADTNIDDELADVDQHARRVFADYCLVKNAQDGQAIADSALLQLFADAEAKAEAQFLSA